MDDLSLAWKEKFEEIWTNGNYRLGSEGERLVPSFLDHLSRADNPLINDYGSGSGRAALKLYQAGFTRINMVDIAENALEEATRAILGNGVTFTLASLWELPEGFPRADWGFCTDVLMTLPPEKVVYALIEIRSTCRNLFVEVYDWADVRLGYDLTATKGGRDWWETVLSAFWPEIKSYPSPENERRYIFVCKDRR